MKTESVPPTEKKDESNKVGHQRSLDEYSVQNLFVGTKSLMSSRKVKTTSAQGSTSSAPNSPVRRSPKPSTTMPQKTDNLPTPTNGRWVPASSRAGTHQKSQQLRSNTRSHAGCPNLAVFQVFGSPGRSDSGGKDVHDDDHVEVADMGSMQTNKLARIRAKKNRPWSSRGRRVVKTEDDSKLNRKTAASRCTIAKQ